MDTQPMTAADHLAKGEQLLNGRADRAEWTAARAAQAQAHFAAARLLFDLEAIRMEGRSHKTYYALESTGLIATVEDRHRVANQRVA
ncbi:hypothetical protein [Streptomyces sp. Ac-502]|uniref:hypothetical protein n=1 Tax=Streptomyces sp. Ac-502 TaxID=3342801 RepID=UPI0038628176